MTQTKKQKKTRWVRWKKYLGCLVTKSVGGGSVGMELDEAEEEEEEDSDAKFLKEAFAFSKVEAIVLTVLLTFGSCDIDMALRTAFCKPSIVGIWDCAPFLPSLFGV